MTLNYIFLIPIIGTIIVGIIPFNTIEEKIRGKQIALITGILTFLESIRLWIGFDASTALFQFGIKGPWSLNISAYSALNSTAVSLPIGAGQVQDNTGLLFGVDGISIYFIILTTLLIPICLLASWDSIKTLEKTYLLCFLGLEILLIGVFTVLDILGFYILFEGVLIPMFLIIGVWGAREQKITAAYYFFFYTLVGSVLMLLSIFYIYHTYGTTDFLTLLTLLETKAFDVDVQKLIFLAFFASFAVKIPSFPFHIWLPQAHVEAPLAGSVILAGILIKLGSYGFIRFALPLLPDASTYFTPFILTLSTLAVIYASLTTLRQTDLKRIIAYSSVSHMGVVMLGIFSLTVIGIEGSIFLQIGHGLVSSALFILVTVLYDRHHSRLVKYYRGIAITMPVYATIFFFFTLANIAVPLSCNFIGEFLCLLAVYDVSLIVLILASFGMVLSACYALFLYNRVCFGTMSPYIAASPFNRDINRREFFVIAPLALLTLLLGLFPNIILDYVHASVVGLLTYVV